MKPTIMPVTKVLPYKNDKKVNCLVGKRPYFLHQVRSLKENNCMQHEIKRCLLLGRKVMTNLDSLFKSRDITLPTKVRLVKAMVFPVVMYGCEGNRRGNSGNSVRLFLGGVQNHCRWFEA